jgi:hypothetical protein
MIEDGDSKPAAETSIILARVTGIGSYLFFNPDTPAHLLWPVT